MRRRDSETNHRCDRLPGSSPDKSPQPPKAFVGVSVQPCCCSKILSTRGLQTTGTYFSQSRKLGSPRLRCQQFSSGESPLPRSWTAVFLQFPHLAERARGLSRVSLIRALIPFMRTLSSRPNHLSKTPPPNTITMGIMFQHTNLGGNRKH